MATITSTGVGSGLDVNSIVTGLMSVEKAPLQQLQTQASSYQTKLSAFGALQGQLGNLGSVAARLADPAAWRPVQADSSDSASVTASAAAGATAAAHTLEVQQLAQPQVLASGYYGSSQAGVGTGKLTIQVGTTAAGAFTPRSGSVAVTVDITAGNNTLAGVRDAINAANAGVTATIVNGAQGSRLVLRTADGADSSVRITAADDDGNATDAAGLSALAWDPAAAAGAGANLTQTQGSQDARFRIDGVDLTSATNSTSTALDGLTLGFKKVTTDPVQVSVSVPTSSLRKNIDDFIGAYNALNSMLQSQTKADPTGKARGALQADSTAVQLLNGLRGMLRGSVTGVADPASLATAGVVLQQDGSLKVDETRLAALLATPDKAAKLFSQAQAGDDATSRGFALRFKVFAEALVKDDGSLGSRVAGLKRSADLNQKQQSAMQDRIDRTEARLRAQYQKLDTDMNDLNARMKQMKAALGLA